MLQVFKKFRLLECKNYHLIDTICQIQSNYVFWKVEKIHLGAKFLI